MGFPMNKEIREILINELENVEINQYYSDHDSIYDK